MTNDDSGSILIISHPNSEMYIIIVSSVEKSKRELLMINDKLGF